MVVLLDTNVLLDYLETREPYFEDSYQALFLCAEEKAEGYVAFHSIPNIFYTADRLLLQFHFQECYPKRSAVWVITENPIGVQYILCGRRMIRKAGGSY